MSDATNTYGEDISLIPIDSQTIHDEIFDELTEVTGPLPYGDERNIFAQGLTSVFVTYSALVNQCAKQVMLKYASGEVLDALGARLGVTRLEGTAAHCTVRFSVQTTRDEDIEIPKYTKVTSDSQHYFAIPEKITLTAGTYYVESVAYATTTGEDSNGITVGTISQLVDKVPYIAKVENTTETTGGDDGEPYTTAGDDRFRERIREAPNKLSCAGPKGAYQYWGLTSTNKIRDLQCVSEHETVRKRYPVYDGKLFIGGSHIDPDTLKVFLNELETADYKSNYEDDLLTVTLGNSFQNQASVYVEFYRTLEGHVKIVPLMEEGQTLDTEVKQDILKVLNDDTVRPMTDYVEIEAPHEVVFDVELSYTVTPATEQDLVAKIENEGGAIDRYIDWQTSKLGRDINPDTLRQLMLSAGWSESTITGVLNVNIVSPTLKELDNTEVAVWSGKKKISHTVKTGVI